MSYRRERTSDTWHWCRNCSKWPSKDYAEQSQKPTTGEQCNECKAKERDGTCQK